MDILMGSAAKRANLSMWKRNAIICACNAMIAEPDAQWVGDLHDRISGLALDDSEDEMIRETARWAITRMSSHT
jgi:epoxyqueuosine reductase QueG